MYNGCNFYNLKFWSTKTAGIFISSSHGKCINLSFNINNTSEFLVHIMKIEEIFFTNSIIRYFKILNMLQDLKVIKYTKLQFKVARPEIYVSEVVENRSRKHCLLIKMCVLH